MASNPELIDLDAFEFTAPTLPDLLSRVSDWTEHNLTGPDTNWYVDLRIEFHPDPDALTGFWAGILYVTRRFDPSIPRG